MKQYHVTGFWSDDKQKGDFCKWEDVELLEEENKRLREELAKRDEYNRQIEEENLKICDAIQAIAIENEKLREALESISNIDNDYPQIIGHYLLKKKCKIIAREALKQKKGKQNERN